jgi:hypothetical protein
MARAERAPRTRVDRSSIALPDLESGETIRAAASQVTTSAIHPFLPLALAIVLWLIAILLGESTIALIVGIGAVTYMMWQRRASNRFVVRTDRRLLFYREGTLRGPQPGLVEQIPLRDLAVRDSKKGMVMVRMLFDVTGTGEEEGRHLILRVQRVNHAFLDTFGDPKRTQVRKQVTHDPSGRTTPKGGKRRR